MNARFEFDADGGALVIDERLEVLIPRLTSEERKGLRENVLANGIEDPLKVWARDGDLVILDGHNRYEIAVANNLPFHCEVIEAVTTHEEAELYMLRRALDKRSLTAAQRIALALQLKPYMEAEAKERQRRGGEEKVSQNSDEAPIRTDEAVARAAGVSRDSVRKAEVVFEEAAPEIVEEVKAGARSIHSAYQEVRPPKAKPATEEEWEDVSDEEDVSAHGEGLRSAPPKSKVETMSSVDSLKAANEANDVIWDVFMRTPKAQQGYLIGVMQISVSQMLKRTQEAAKDE